MDRRSNIVKQVVLKVLSVAVLVYSFVVTSMGADHSGTRVNLAENPGFEEADAKNPTMPAVWSPENWGTSGGKSTFIWDDKVVHSGKKSISIQAPPGSSGVWVEWYQSPAHFKAGKSYQMTAWMKSENASSGSGIIFDACIIMLRI